MIATLDDIGTAHAIGWRDAAAKNAKRREFADYCGFLQPVGPFPGYDLWTLKQTLSEDLIQGSTIAEETLDAAIGLR